MLIFNPQKKTIKLSFDLILNNSTSLEYTYLVIFLQLLFNFPIFLASK